MSLQDREQRNRTECLSELEITRSRVHRCEAFQTVKLFNSTLDKLEGISQENLSLVMVQSELSLLSNAFFTSQSGIDFGITIDNSTIRAMKNVTVENGASIMDSFIGMINQTILHRVLMVNTRVGLVPSKGLTLVKGQHQFGNVVFDKLEKHALAIEDGSLLDLMHLKIMKCDAPCIILRSKNSTYEGIEINGTVVEDLEHSPFAVRDVPITDKHLLLVKLNEDVCIQEIAAQICDFKNITKVSLTL